MAASVSATGQLAEVSVHIKCAKELYCADTFGGKSDPYVVVSIGDVSAKTSSKENETSPEFNETLSLQLSQQLIAGAELKIQVYDEDTLKDDPIGHAFLKLEPDNVNGEDVWCDLVHGDGEKQGSVCVAVTAALAADTSSSRTTSDSKKASEEAESKSTEADEAAVETPVETAETKAADSSGALPAAQAPVEASPTVTEGESPDTTKSSVTQLSTSSESKDAQQAPQTETAGAAAGGSATAPPDKSANTTTETKSGTAEEVVSEEKLAPDAAETDEKQEAVTAGAADKPAAGAAGADEKPVTTAGEPATASDAPITMAAEESKADPDSSQVEKPTKSATTGSSSDTPAPEKKATVEEIEAYLQEHVVPVLQEGLTQLAEVQPAKPLGWLAKFIALHAAAE